MRVYDILLVEDEPDILEANRALLEGRGRRVTAVRTCREAEEALAAGTPDLAVLDILLPDGSGLELCRSLHECSPAPVIFLTCLGESGEVIRGLREGGSDYIVKPYRPEELLARVEAQLDYLERLKRAQTDTGTARLTLEPMTCRALLDGVDLLLKPKEYLLLAALLRHRRRFVTAGELYETVWGMGANRDTRTVRVHISNLRGKLREAGGTDFDIESSKHNGYRLVLPGGRGGEGRP